MNKLLVGSIALVAMGLGGSAVRAADLPLKAPPPVPVFSWTGCYVGLDAGETYGRSDGYSTIPGSRGTVPGGPGVALPPGVNLTDGFNLNGGIGGVYYGCNYQFAGTGFVVGVEGDWSFDNKEGQAFITPGAFATTAAAAGFGNPNDVWYLQERQIGTARVRLGYAVTPNWLLYVTGGGAWAKIDSSEAIITAPTNSATKDIQSNWRGGWTVGAGTEYEVGYGWAVRSEFLYVDFGNFTTFTNIPVGVIGSNTFTNLNVNLHEYIWRFGLSYKFGWSPAVVARY
jgi:outer membrane immunogenic protein